MPQLIYKCPICELEMEVVVGDRINPNNGITVICNRKECPSMETVIGHGTNEKNAYDIACQKYGHFHKIK